MKENYKKEYEDLIEKLRNARKDVNKKDSRFSQIIDDIVPNLIESKDEIIRTKLLKLLKELLELGGVAQDTWSMNDCEQFIAWLEEQNKKAGVLYELDEDGEYHRVPSRKATGVLKEMLDELQTQEPKFMFGNWYLCIKNFYGKGVRFDKGTAYYCSLDGCLQEFDEGAHICIDKNLYEYFKIWTIQDAKAGDVLADGNLPFIFKRIDSMQRSYAYCGVSGDGEFKVKSDGELGEWTWMQDIKPATKEQRELLFQKMHEAGYEWDAEKKELKKVEQKSANNVIEKEKPLLEKFKQAVYNCAWGKVTCKKEGETKEEYAERWAEQFLLITRDWADDYIDFTIQQKLRNSYEKGKTDIIEEQDEQKPAWSEEDEKQQSKLIRWQEEWLSSQKNGGYMNNKNLIKSIEESISWLHHIKDRVQPHPQDKWKESLATADLENFLCDIQDGFSDTSYEYRKLGEAIEFIRCTEPKPHKPSEISPNGVYPEADGVRIWHDGHTFKIPKNWNKGLWPLLNDVGRRKASMNSSYFCELDTQFDWNFIEATKKIQELGTDIPLNEDEFLITMPIFHAIYLNRWELNVALNNMGAEEIKLGENIWIAQRRSKSEAFGYNKYNNLTRFSVGSINRCIIIMP